MLPSRAQCRDTKSDKTSWTTDKRVAENCALRPKGDGVILEKTVPKSQTISSPNAKSKFKTSPGEIISEIGSAFKRTY